MTTLIQHQYRLRRVLIAAMLFGLLLSACLPDLPPPQSTITPILPTSTPTPIPLPTSTLPPLGQSGNPLRLAVVSEEFDQGQLNAAIQLAARLDELTDIRIQAEIYLSHQEVLAGLRNQTIQIAFLPPLTYLLAQRRYQAEVALLTNHFGVYQYGTQFLARNDGRFSIYFDPQSNQSTADGLTALRQFNDLRPCWTEPDSISGFILPAGLLLQNQVSIEPAVIIQSHTAVIRALYTRGICDFGATFAYTGDPRTASSLTDLGDLEDEIIVIWQSDAVIPNTNISYHPRLEEDVRSDLTEAFLEIASTEAGLILLTNALDYEVQALKEVDDSIYDPLRIIIRQTQTDLNAAVGK
jgi:phosphonate transport system substrate-binding protein